MTSPFLRYTWDSKPVTEPRAFTMRMNSRAPLRVDVELPADVAQRCHQLLRRLEAVDVVRAPGSHRGSSPRRWCGNAFNGVVEQAVVAALRFAQHGFGVLALGDVLDETFESDRPSLDVDDTGPALPHPTDAAVRVDDAVFDVEGAEFGHGAPGSPPAPRADRPGG